MISTAMFFRQRESRRSANPHWQSEWAIVTAGSVRIFAVDEDGKNQIDDVQVGDIWYFPKGQAHGVQGACRIGDYGEPELI